MKRLTSTELSSIIRTEIDKDKSGKKIHFINSEWSETLYKRWSNQKFSIEDSKRSLGLLRVVEETFDIVFVALYNSSHFSLLCAMNDKIIHYNSIEGSNLELAGFWSGMLPRLGLFSKAEIYKRASPQQADDWSCGYYVIAFVELLLRRKDHFDKMPYININAVVEDVQKKLNE